MSRINVNPTRIELTKSKTRLKAAIKGHKLLKDKSDEMIRQFLDLARQSKELREDVGTELSEALKFFAVSQALGGLLQTEQALRAPSVPLEIKLSIKSIMGVSVPIFRMEETVKAGDVNHMPQKGNSFLGYALSAAPPQTDETVFKLSALVQRLIKLAEAEKSCALLSVEIERTRRRVNALEYIMIPQLQDTINYIQMKLDENERGALARLMQVKSKLDNESN